LPDFASPATHAAILGATVHFANRSALKRRTLVYVPQITFAIPVGAANLHCLKIPRAMLLALVHHLYWPAACGMRADTGRAVFVNRSLADMLCLHQLKAELCVLRSVNPVDFLGTTAIARPIHAAGVNDFLIYYDILPVDSACRHNNYSQFPQILDDLIHVASVFCLSKWRRD